MTKGAENILNGLIHLKYSYIQLDPLVLKYGLSLVLKENVLIVGDNA